jgi:hypothetical protein
VRFWKNLPEGELIPGLITQARMGKQQNGQASGIADRTGKLITSKNHKQTLTPALSRREREPSEVFSQNTST